MTFGVSGNHNRGHGSKTGMWVSERTRVCGDRRSQGSTGTWPSGVFQVRKATNDPHEEPVGREGVEWTLE